MWHKPCRTFHPWCPCIKTRCLLSVEISAPRIRASAKGPHTWLTVDNEVSNSALRWRHNGGDSLTIVYSTVYSGADQSKHQSSPSLAFVWGIHRGPVNSPHKWPVTRNMFSFDDVIMWMLCTKHHYNVKTIFKKTSHCHIKSGSLISQFTSRWFFINLKRIGVLLNAL